MPDSQLHIAQLNIAQMRAPLEDPVMAGFVARLDEINALADRSPGFVWRLQTEDGNATSICAFDDEELIVNLSVWETVAALRHFVYHTVHRELIRDRKQWFHKMSNSHLVLWTVTPGHQPSVTEARQKLATLQQHGPSAAVFTFASVPGHLSGD